jgi:outer membrane biosynthesis protein TonB
VAKESNNDHVSKPQTPEPAKQSALKSTKVQPQKRPSKTSHSKRPQSRKSPSSRRQASRQTSTTPKASKTALGGGVLLVAMSMVAMSLGFGHSPIKRSISNTMEASVSQGSSPSIPEPTLASEPSVEDSILGNSILEEPSSAADRISYAPTPLETDLKNFVADFGFPE